MLIVLDVNNGFVVKLRIVRVRNIPVKRDISDHCLNSLIDYWNIVFSYSDTLILNSFDLVEPIMSSYVLDCVPLYWVSIQNLLDQVLAVTGDKPWYQIVAVEYLLVQLIGVRIFEGQIATGHRIKDNATAPNIRDQAMVSLSSNHFRSCIARTSTCCFERFPLTVCIG